MSHRLASLFICAALVAACSSDTNPTAAAGAAGAVKPAIDPLDVKSPPQINGMQMTPGTTATLPKVNGMQMMPGTTAPLPKVQGMQMTPGTTAPLPQVKGMQMTPG